MHIVQCYCKYQRSSIRWNKLRVAIAARRHSLFLIDHILSSSVHHGVFDPADADADADSDNADDADAGDVDAGEELHLVFLIGHILPPPTKTKNLTIIYRSPVNRSISCFFWLFFIYFTCTHAYQQQSFCWWLH